MLRVGSKRKRLQGKGRNQKVIFRDRLTPITIVCVRIREGQWLATEVHEKTAAVAETKTRAEKALRDKVLAMSESRVASKIAGGAHRNGGDGSKQPGFDFFAAPSAAELARAQRVGRVRKLGQIRGFSNPDPKEADWFARAIRRWRRDAGSRRTNVE